MKKIILSLFLSAPFFAAAQKLDVSLNAGAAINSNLIWLEGGNHLGINPTFEIKTMLPSKRRWTWGGSLEIGTLNHKFNAYYMEAGVQKERDMMYHVANPFVAANVLTGPIFKFSNQQIGTGTKLGILYAFSNEGKYSKSEAYASSSEGAEMGLYFDYAYYFRKVGVGVNFNPKVIVLRGDSFLSWPVTLGVHIPM